MPVFVGELEQPKIRPRLCRTDDMMNDSSSIGPDNNRKAREECVASSQTLSRMAWENDLLVYSLLPRCQATCYFIWQQDVTLLKEMPEFLSICPKRHR